MSELAAKTLLNKAFPSDANTGRKTIQDILDELQSVDWLQSDLFGIHLALEEAMTNAIKHGNRNNKNKFVSVRCELTPSKLSIEISDQGPGFNPAEVPDPTGDDRLDLPSGRGIALMRNFMCRVDYREPGNCVVLEKNRSLNGAMNGSG